MKLFLLVALSIGIGFLTYQWLHLDTHRQNDISIVKEPSVLNNQQERQLFRMHDTSHVTELGIGHLNNKIKTQDQTIQHKHNPSGLYSKDKSINVQQLQNRLEYLKHQNDMK